jgi:hypothetical protein
MISGIASADFTASGTAYSKALAGQEKWTEDAANDFVSMPNSFACIISNSGGDVNANATWTALIDEVACGLADADPTSKAVKYSRSAMKSSRASNSSAQETSAWFNAQGGMRYIADVTLKQSAATLAPFGEWYFSFYNAGILNGGTWTDYTKDTSGQYGYVDIGPSGNDVSILVAEEGKVTGTQVGGGANPNNFYHEDQYAKVLFVGGSSANTKFLGKTYDHQTVIASGAATGAATTAYVAGATSATHYYRRPLDSSFTPGAATCFDRSQQFETVHESGLYNVTTGALKTINGGFGFKLADGTRGYLGQWGAWIDSDAATFTPTNRSVAVTDDNDTSYTLKWAPGSLMQRTFVNDTLADGDTFKDFWYDREESGSWASDHIEKAVWDNSNNRFTFTKSSDSSTINVSSSSHNIWMYSPVKDTWVAWNTGTTIKLDNMKNVLFSSTFADATSTKFVSQRSSQMDHTKASSLPYSLIAFNNASDMAALFYDASTATSQKTYFLTGSTPATGLEANTLYLDNGDDALSTADKPIRFDFTLNDNQDLSTNYSDSATASFTSSDSKDPFGRIDLYLASEASGASPTNYIWEFSAPNWAHSTTAYDSAGTAVALDDPIKFLYTYASADDRNNGMTINVVSEDSYNPLQGCSVSGGVSTCSNVQASDYNGQKFQLEYDGKMVQGFPGMEVCSDATCSGGQYYMRLVNLTDGTQLTDTDSNTYAFLGHAISSVFKESAGGTADCDTAGISFTTLADLGIAASDIPTVINKASTDYPLPSSGWTDAPTTSSCTVTMGDTSSCN